MSGHSKWSQIKRQKGVTDARRGQIFTKLSHEITWAARQGGADPAANFRLRLAIQKARDHNMPLENIERAIKRGVGGGEGIVLDEVAYEGYGPAGVAIIVQAVTDNRNRTISEIRNVFSRGGGSLGEAGCVSWLFEKRGLITIESPDQSAEGLALMAIDAGADDVRVEDSVVEIVTRPEDLERVRKALEEQKVAIPSAEIAMVPKALVDVPDRDALQTLKLLEKLEELDEVQHVFTNANFPDAVLEKQRP